MKYLFAVLLSFIFFALPGQSILFNKVYDFTNLWENMNGVYEDDDAFYYIQNNVGFTYEDNQLFFVKANKEGDVIWNYSFCGDSAICQSTRGAFLKRQNANTFIVGGEYRPHPDTLADGMIFELSTNGDSLHLIRYGDEGSQGFTGLIAHPEDGYVAIGGSRVQDPSGDIYIVRIDNELEIVWEQIIHQPGFQVAYSVAPTLDGGYFIVGKGLLSFGMAQILALKVDSLGNVEWSQILGGEGNNDGRHNGTVLSDGNLLVAATRASDFDNNRGYIAKLNQDGEILWEENYFPNSRNFFSTNILELEDGNFVVGGAKYVFGTIYSSISKISSDGELIWEQLYHGRLPIDCYFWGIQRAADGGFLAYGMAFGPDPVTQQDGWLIKMDSEGQSCSDEPGCLLVNIEEVRQTGQAKLVIGPNPATEQALILYYLPKALPAISLQVFDLNGRLLFTEKQMHSTLEGGTQLAVDTWPSGMYAVQLYSGGELLAAEKLVVR